MRELYTAYTSKTAEGHFYLQRENDVLHILIDDEGVIINDLEEDFLDQNHEYFGVRNPESPNSFRKIPIDSFLDAYNQAMDRIGLKDIPFAASGKAGRNSDTITHEKKDAEI